MRLTVDRTALVDKLNILARGVSTRSALPVLSGVLLQAGDGRLDLFATDMELSIKASLVTNGRAGRRHRRPGAAVHRRRAQPSERDRLHRGRRSGRQDHRRPRGVLAELVGGERLSADVVVRLEGSLQYRPRSRSSRRWARSGRAASRDETRPILTGVLLSLGGNVLKMVATDSYRLAVKETTLESEIAGEVQAIVPVKALTEVARLATTLGDGDVEVAIGENQALFKLADEGGDVYLASRLIDGQFPNYKQLIPESFDHEVTPRQGARHRRRPDAPACSRNATHRCGSRSRPGKLTMRALTQDVGQAEESLDIPYDGDEFEIGFNPQYLIEGIEAVDESDVKLRFTNPLRPGLVSRAPEGSFVYLIMPIRLSG